MSDNTIGHLDLTNCSRPYDFFARIHKAFGFEECGFNWDAIYDFMRTETPVETLYITGESTVSPELQEFVTMMHTVFDDVNQHHQDIFGIPFTYIVLS